MHTKAAGLIALAAIVAAATTAAQERIGPSFDCAKAQAPLAKIICADPELSRLDLRFTQAYWALMHQAAEGGKRNLKQEDIRFINSVQVLCGIPRTGSLDAQSPTLRNCIRTAYEKQRSHWLGELNPPGQHEPPPYQEAIRAPERHIELQRALQRLGLLATSVAIDGVYGAETRQAIAEWQRTQNRDTTGFLSDGDEAALDPGEHVVSSSQPPSKPNAGLFVVVDDIRNTLVDARIGYTGLTVEGAAVVFTIRDRARIEDAKKALLKIDQHLTVETFTDGTGTTSFRITPPSRPANTATSERPANNCQIVNDYPDRGSDVRWTGECKDGQAEGAGVARWYRSGIVYFQQTYSKERGLMRRAGKPVAVPDSIDKGLTFDSFACTNGDYSPGVRAHADDSLALDDIAVVSYIAKGPASKYLATSCNNNQTKNAGMFVILTFKKKVVCSGGEAVRYIYDGNLKTREYNNCALSDHQGGDERAYLAEQNRRETKARAEASAEAQRQAEEERQHRIMQARTGLEKARIEFAQIPESDEVKAFVNPVLTVYRNKRGAGFGMSEIVCSETYEYVGGTLIGRSIEGNVGVFLIAITAVNKSDSPVSTGSVFGSICGNPSRPLQPGERLSMEVKAQFRKYDTGWRFEHVAP